jgi:hypothetical protein
MPTRQIAISPAAPPPEQVEIPEMEPVVYINMEEDNESEEDILERQVALSPPVGSTTGKQPILPKITIAPTTKT